MRIALAADHRGQDVLRHLLDRLMREGHRVDDCGLKVDRNCDYPDMAYPVARRVATGEADRGILICGTGVGMCITANKVAGVRAACVHDEIGAEMSRRHNDANVLCLAADFLGLRIIDRIVEKWLATEFDGGRHARRVQKITAIEQGRDPATVIDTSTAAA
jgi:ribose 5-phosphate isomerase B